jgi:hypothetical protein
VSRKRPPRDKRKPAYYNRPAGTCEATGKAIYLTKKAAKDANRYWSNDCRPFTCAYCNGFHLGHQHGKPRQWHREQQQRKAAGSNGDMETQA